LVRRKGTGEGDVLKHVWGHNQPKRPQRTIKPQLQYKRMSDFVSVNCLRYNTKERSRLETLPKRHVLVKRASKTIKKGGPVPPTTIWHP
jgi:hypothetical protein